LTLADPNGTFCHDRAFHVNDLNDRVWSETVDPERRVTAVKIANFSDVASVVGTTAISRRSDVVA
jgi:hypothetical protein